MFLQVGTPPLVDGLIGIADDGEISMYFGQPPDEQVLRPIRILILVDHHVLELPRVEVPRLLRRLEELDRFQQQVVEIERVAVFQRDQVSLVDLRDLLVAKVVVAPRASPAPPSGSSPD